MNFLRSTLIQSAGFQIVDQGSHDVAPEELLRRRTLSASKKETGSQRAPTEQDLIFKGVHHLIKRIRPWLVIPEIIHSL